MVPAAIEVERGQLTAYEVHPGGTLAKGTVERDWMDKTGEKFAYRCLPLVIANQMGWDIINPVPFTAFWNGSPLKEGIVVSWNTGAQHHSVTTHFGNGVLTFTIPFLFRTPPGVNLWVKGPPNWPKDGICALEGVVETDWPVSTFTMNWLFTRTNHLVSFAAGEPICRIIPIPRYITELLDPVIAPLGDNPGLKARYEEWCAKRNQFNNALHVRNPEVVKQGWQKDYFKGEQVPEHQTKLNQSEFHRPT